jgi:RNA 3'-terminal phosphate cyclase (ATP)
MIEIDGGQKSGSGTLVRYAVAFAALLGQPLHLFNARTKREKPGLRAQHLTSVLACAEMCGAKTEGLSVGSLEFKFIPGSKIKGGSFAWDIGTAGSTTMLALSILPLACFADAPVAARITGGVFQDFAPSPHHIQRVLAPLLERMGLAMRLEVIRPGYVPKGAGVVELSVTPVRDRLKALALAETGAFKEVSGVALSSRLEERRVSERMARVCEERLAKADLSANVERVYDKTGLHPGAILAIWAKSSTGCIFGADRAGALGRSSEAIGRSVAEIFLADIVTRATVDRHVADQLVLFAALADGLTRYIIPRQTDHVESNLWLAEIFGAKPRGKERHLVIEGIGFRRR